MKMNKREKCSKNKNFKKKQKDFVRKFLQVVLLFVSIFRKWKTNQPVCESVANHCPVDASDNNFGGTIAWHNFASDIKFHP